MIEADWLVLLTDVDYLYTANPSVDPTATPIKVLTRMRRCSRLLSRLLPAGCLCSCRSRNAALIDGAGSGCARLRSGCRACRKSSRSRGWRWTPAPQALPGARAAWPPSSRRAALPRPRAAAWPSATRRGQRRSRRWWRGATPAQCSAPCESMCGAASAGFCQVRIHAQSDARCVCAVVIGALGPCVWLLADALFPARQRTTQKPSSSWPELKRAGLGSSSGPLRCQSASCLSACEFGRHL